MELPPVFSRAGRRATLIPVDPYYLVHRAEELGYHPQVIHDFFTKNRVKTALRVGLQFLVAKMMIRGLNEAVKAQQKGSQFLIKLL